MRLPIVFIMMLIAGCASTPVQDPLRHLTTMPDPSSPDFDPVSYMKLLKPNWEPPEYSEEEISRFQLGTAQNPVRAQGPRGEHEYLRRLVCQDSQSPEFKRLGSSGHGPYGFMLDRYEVKCTQGPPATIYMDMYHPRYIEKQAVAGFSIADAP